MYSKTYPTCTDEKGNINNYIDCKESNYILSTPNININAIGI